MTRSRSSRATTISRRFEPERVVGVPDEDVASAIGRNHGRPGNDRGTVSRRDLQQAAHEHVGLDAAVGVVDRRADSQRPRRRIDPVGDVLDTPPDLLLRERELDDPRLADLHLLKIVLVDVAPDQDVRLRGDDQQGVVLVVKVPLNDVSGDDQPVTLGVKGHARLLGGGLILHVINLLLGQAIDRQFLASDLQRDLALPLLAERLLVLPLGDRLLAEQCRVPVQEPTVVLPLDRPLLEGELGLGQRNAVQLDERIALPNSLADGDEHLADQGVEPGADLDQGVGVVLGRADQLERGRFGLQPNRGEIQAQGLDLPRASRRRPFQGSRDGPGFDSGLAPTGREVAGDGRRNNSRPRARRLSGTAPTVTRARPPPTTHSRRPSRRARFLMCSRDDLGAGREEIRFVSDRVAGVLVMGSPDSARG